MTSVHLAASRTYPATVGHAFDKVVTMPLPELFRDRYGPLPPIRSAQGFTEPWGTVGQTRRITLSDGGTLLETLTTVERSTGFGYHIDSITGALKPLVASIEGAWSFEPAGTGVRITWAWAVEPASTVAGYLMPVFGRLWRGYARQALENLEEPLLA